MKNSPQQNIFVAAEKCTSASACILFFVHNVTPAVDVSQSKTVVAHHLFSLHLLSSL